MLLLQSLLIISEFVSVHAT